MQLPHRVPSCHHLYNFLLAFNRRTGREDSSTDGLRACIQPPPAPLAPAVVGDFRQLITVSVFRTETIPEALVRQGLTQESGYATCVEPQARQDSTMRFQLLRSAVAPPAPGSSPAGTPGGAGGQAYEFEFRWEPLWGGCGSALPGLLHCTPLVCAPVSLAPPAALAHVQHRIVCGGDRGGHGRQAALPQLWVRELTAGLRRGAAGMQGL